ncbi:protein gar2-like [Nicotiana sylvestris]|uniref:protein gar2-like n=1 Tax=Nicotiana sylvestris TaxID=4096 RepID=UPI00388C9560
MVKPSISVPHDDVPPPSLCSSKGKATTPPNLEEFIPGSCEMISDFKIEKPSSKPGRCEPISRYISLVADGEKESLLDERSTAWGRDTPKPDKKEKRRRESSIEPTKSKKAKVEEPKVGSAALTPGVAESPQVEGEEKDDSSVASEGGKTLIVPHTAETVASKSELHVVVVLPQAEEAFEGASGDVLEPQMLETRRVLERTELQLTRAMEHAWSESLWRTLEDIHVRGIDLPAELEIAKTLEEKATTLLASESESISG